MDNLKQLLLKRPINVKAVVTNRWKDEAQQQLQVQINQIDSQLQQLEIQGQRMVAEIKRQSLQPLGPDAMQKIDSIQVEVNERKSQLLEQKNQNLQQLQQVQTLELEQEVVQGQIESIFYCGRRRQFGYQNASRNSSTRWFHRRNSRRYLKGFG